MLTAIVSDIHGNLEALEAVLADVQTHHPDRIFCLGDFVGYGASPNECIERLRPEIAGAVIGNHDVAAIGRLQLTYFNNDAAVAARWTDVRLTPENRAYLEQLPYTVRHPGMLLVHASPEAPEEWRYVLSPADAEYEMATYPEPLCFIGHSHYPGAFALAGTRMRYTREHEIRIDPGQRYLINVGSVGQPRDGDPRAAYALHDDQARRVRHMRIEYDVAAAGERIRSAGLPDFLAARLEWGE